jgi:cytosine deaminase
MMTGRDREILYDMITHNPARIMRIKDYGIREGNEANLVILDAVDLRKALTDHSAPSHVIRHGGLVEITQR